MRTVSSAAALHDALERDRGQVPIALVPTMGNLHAGHMRLVDRARQLAERVVVSIFVNPLQFGENEDLDAYPRTLAADQARLEARGVEVLFNPGVDDIYPFGMAASTRVTVPDLPDILCGASRPGHFDGVTTVVCKLLSMVQPDVAVFGRKDYQQLALISRMVTDLGMPVHIEGVATARADDGLALSSRNQYLTDEERQRAPALHRVLRGIAEARLAGQEDIELLEREGMQQLKRAGFEPEYVRLMDPSLDGPARNRAAFVVLGAGRLGAARLIDNLGADELPGGRATTGDGQHSEIDGSRDR